MLFNRAASLVITDKNGGVAKELSGLRFTFSIQKGATKTPNKCSLRLFNASQDTIRLVDVIGNVLILKAGYADDIGAITIFSGNITRCLTVREGPDRVTEVEMMDGLLEFRDTKVSISLNSGATTSQVIMAICSKFGLPVRSMPNDVADKTYNAGFAFVGRARDAMDRVCANAGLEWSIQNRELQIIKSGGVFKQNAILLSPDTGLIGSPAQEAKTMTERAASKLGVTIGQPGVRKTTDIDKDGNIQECLQVIGYKVKSFLQPIIEPGAYVQVRSDGIDGEFFRVEELTHVGDTHGNDWHTDMTLRFV